MPENLNSNGTPNSWRLAKLADICDLVQCMVKPQDLDTLPYVGLEHIDSGEFAIRRWGRSTDVKSAKNEFQSGDVLYGKLRPYLDKAVLADWRGLCSTELIVLRVKKGLVLPDYLLGLVHTTPFVRHAINTTAGTNLPRTSWSALRELKLPLPPLAEQKAIAHVLRTVQQAKEATEKVIAATRQLKQSLMKHLFTYGPVPFDQADKVELKETEIGPVPRHWEVRRFDDIATLQRGQDLPRYEFKAGDFPVVGATSIIGYHDKFNVRGPGVTVVRSGSSAGLPLYIDRNFWAHNVVLYVKDFHGNDPKFIYYRLLTLQLTKYRAGVAVPTLNRNTFKHLDVAVPATEEQKTIVQLLDAVDAATAQREKKRDALSVLFSSVLHHLMTGKLQVPLNGDQVLAEAV